MARIDRRASDPSFGQALTTLAKSASISGDCALILRRLNCSPLVFQGFLRIVRFLLLPINV